MSVAKIISCLAVAGIAGVNALAVEPRQATNLWETLPPTGALPTPINETLSDSNGAKLWMQTYNKEAGGVPTVFIHGGGGYSAHFADVINRLVAVGKYCIAVDRRGHGRSTYLPTDVWTFDMFANEIYTQLASVGVSNANWVGWSDGAATTYAALQNATIDATINKAFVFGGFFSPEDSNVTYTETAIYAEFVTRLRAEYAELRPQGNFTEFATLLGTLESTLPQFTVEGLGKIDGSKVAVVYAEHEEAVNLDVPLRLHQAIPESTLIELKGVSHFAPMQNPTQFVTELLKYLGSNKKWW